MCANLCPKTLNQAKFNNMLPNKVISPEIITFPTKLKKKSLNIIYFSFKQIKKIAAENFRLIL